MLSCLQGVSVVLQLTLGVPFLVIIGSMIMVTVVISLLYTLLFLSSLCILFSPGVKPTVPLRAQDEASCSQEESPEEDVLGNNL